MPSGSKNHFELKRTYNSRSLSHGIFGFGWCSPLEDSIRWQGRQIFLNDCSGTQPVQLQNEGQNWIRKLENGAFQKFNSQGRLVAMKEEGKSLELIFIYQGPRLHQLKFGTSLAFFFYNLDDASLQKIEVKQKFKILSVQLYRFQNRNLISVSSNPSHQITYQYDLFHNLSAWSFQKKYMKINYDNAKDQVKDIESSDGCHEIYQFAHSSATTLESNFERTCPQLPALKRHFIFRSIAKSGRQLFLKEILFRENNKNEKTIRIGEINDPRKLP